MRLLIFFIAILIAISAGAETEPVPTASVPLYKPGDTWTFTYQREGGGGSDAWDNGTYTAVVGNDGALSVFRVKNSTPEKEPYATGLQKETSFFLTYNTQSTVEWLRFPLNLGIKWKGKRWYHSRGGWKYPIVKVLDEERITVPAGTFRSFKINLSDGRSRGTRTAEYYYSPETKSILKFHAEVQTGVTHRLVLINYSIAK